MNCGAGMRMDKFFTRQSIAVRANGSYFSPEKLATLKRIFETVCAEASISHDANDERESLASKMLIAGESNDDEASLFAAALKAIADYRK